MTGRLGLVVLSAAVLTASAVAAPGDREKRDIRPADQALARKANLRLGDLPAGFRAKRLSSKADSASEDAGPDSCPGFAPDLSDLVITGEASSPQFKSTWMTIHSSAEVYRSIGDERKSWRRTARREAVDCLADAIDKQPAAGMRLTLGATLQRPSPRVGERSVSFRLVGRLTTNGVKIPIWIDLLGVSRGRADATLFVMTGLKAPSASFEHRLLATLDRRFEPR